MADHLKRTLVYYRAEWAIAAAGKITLEQCIADTCKKLNSVKDRSIQREDRVASIAEVVMRKKSKGHFLHLVTERPGEAASIVPTKLKVHSKIDIQHSPPPADFEFMSGDAFLFVKGNDVCICTTSMHPAAVEYILRELFKKAKIRSDADKFTLMRVANVTKTNKIKREGVKCIEVSASMYEATASYHQRKSDAIGILSAIAREWRAISGNERDVTDDSVRAKLIFTVDRRRKGGIALGTKRIERFALDLVKNEDDADDFTIVTNDGSKLSASEIYVRQVVSIERSGNSVDRNSAWGRLESFYEHLVDSDQIDED